jgi:hypothetical protein
MTTLSSVVDSRAQARNVMYIADWISGFQIGYQSLQELNNLAKALSVA